MTARRVADILTSALSADGTATSRSRFLREHPVYVTRDETAHRIAGYDRRSGKWVTFCGIPYESDAYKEEVVEGETGCMACLAML